MVAPAKPVEIAPPAQAPSEKVAGTTVLVKGFRFVGAVLIPESELQAQASRYVGHEIDFAQLQSLIRELTGYYFKKGFLARVLVPPQDIKDGVIEIRVIEGVRGSLIIDKQGERVDAGRISRFLNGRLPEGGPMDLARLSEAMAILKEQPGLIAATALKPGAKEGEVTLVVTAADKPLVTGSVGLNNQGSRGTGEDQAQMSLVLNNPTGNFDAASVVLNGSQGNTYGRADYSLAVGDDGLRLGVNASTLDYRIVQSSFSALALKGVARTYGVTASYPLTHLPAFSMNLTGTYDVKTLTDRSVVGETSNRQVTVVNIGINGTFTHGIGLVPGNAITSFGVGLSVGESDQHNTAARATDSTTRQVNGNYTKIAYNLADLAPIDEYWSYNAVLHGQFAGKNLDSSERLSLGGLGGVRAYPVGEATGDDGWVINLNLKRALGDALAATVFCDIGGITLNHATWSNWNASTPNLPNRYTLAGIGAGVDWRFTSAALLSASVAVPVGSNPGRDASNHNVDGRSNHGRVWLSLNAQF